MKKPIALQRPLPSVLFLKNSRERMLSSKVTLIKSTALKVYQHYAILDHLMFFFFWLFFFNLLFPFLQTSRKGQVLVRNKKHFSEKPK